LQRGRFRIPPRSQSEIDHLTICINGAPKVAPFASGADVGFIDVPVDTCPAQVLFGSLGLLRREFLDPANDRRSVDRDPSLFQKVCDILIGQRIAQISPHGTKDDFTLKPVVFERGLTRHDEPQMPKNGQTAQIMQQSH